MFSALGLREGWLYSQLPDGERYLDPLVEGAQLWACRTARVPRFAPALVRWTDGLFPGETAAERRLRVAVCALSDIAWRDHPDVRAEESFRRLLQFPFIGLDHAERVFIAAAIHARYAGKPDDRGSSAGDRPAAGERPPPRADPGPRHPPGLPALRRRAGDPGRRAPADPRRRVRLEVGHAARVPDSEVVGDRLSSWSQAIGVRRTEVAEIHFPLASVEDSR